jgi:hypothetical protein
MSTEEYQQEQAEAGKFDKSIDSSAYQKVFQALGNQPVHTLSPNFADKVVEKILQKKTSRITGAELTLAIVGVAFSIIIFIIAIILTGFKIQLGFLESLQSFKGLMIFGIAFILLLNWFDKLVVRRKVSV